MTEWSLENIAELITELRTKKLLSAHIAEYLLSKVENEDEFVSFEIAGILHALIEDNEITAADADPYLKRLGISQEDLDFHRERQRKEKDEKRRLN